MVIHDTVLGVAGCMGRCWNFYPVASMIHIKAKMATTIMPAAILPPRWAILLVTNVYVKPRILKNTQAKINSPGPQFHLSTNNCPRIGIMRAAVQQVTILMICFFCIFIISRAAGLGVHACAYREPRFIAPEAICLPLDLPAQADDLPISDSCTELGDLDSNQDDTLQRGESYH